MSSVARTTASASDARRRPDLRVSAQQFQRRRVWSVQDPVALRYFHFNDEEFWLLERLDGRTSPDKLRAEFEIRFAPRKLDPRTLYGFLTQLHREGLIVMNAAGQGELLYLRRADLRREEFWGRWLRPFAIRFRGIDPDPLLNRAYPAVRPLFSSTALTALCLLLATALGIFVTHAQLFFTEARGLGDFFAADTIAWALLLIGGTRLIHEAAHAFTCKHFGGECHELGFMLFMFTPSVYCDVSSAWMIADKRARMAIGAAGIIADLAMAAVAILLWRFSEPGTLHALCLFAAVYCSVNTLLVNGNPLMRYDGYHVLVDALEIPDLARRAGGVWRQWAMRLWLGREAADREIDPADVPSTAGGAALSALYAAASQAYLLLVIYLAVTVFQRWAREQHITFLGTLMTTAVLFGMAALPAVRQARRWSQPDRQASLRTPRFWLVTALVVAFLALGLFLPLPRTIHATGRLRPAGVDALYVVQPGFLQSITAGGPVAAGDTIAVLRDDELRSEVVVLETQRERAALNVQNLERRQPLAAAGTIDLPTARQTLRDVEARLAEKQRQAERLALKAPRAGRVIAAPRRPARPPDARELSTWTGSLADEENRGAYLDVGVLVAEIGDPQRCEAVAIVGQEDVLFVRPEAEVELLVDVAANRRLTGRVKYVGQTAADPRERSIGEGATAEASRTPRNVEFEVHIVVDEAAEVTFDAPIQVRIQAASESLWTKGRRLLAQTSRLH